jgi:hypothetical protein
MVTSHSIFLLRKDVARISNRICLVLACKALKQVYLADLKSLYQDSFESPLSLQEEIQNVREIRQLLSLFTNVWFDTIKFLP